MLQGIGYLCGADVANPSLIDAKPEAGQSGSSIRLVFRKGCCLS